MAPAPGIPGRDPVCRLCAHYFVTWVQTTPHGCRALGFKSRQVPSTEVRRNSGEACRYFTPARRG
ncbi:MAG: uracil-DNA glycosylase [Deltaproteobacteria bacterium]|nr:uracil-DNA glycosylase [Deltaproteobacteria bacterium]